jgi:hypothetical protein
MRCCGSSELELRDLVIYLRLGGKINAGGLRFDSVE